MEDNYYVYIAANSVHTVFYTGVTANLVKRMFEHKKKINGGFTARYNISKLLYFEHYTDIYDAIAREKQIKAGSRAKKVGLIANMNPGWLDLPLE